MMAQPPWRFGRGRSERAELESHPTLGPIVALPYSYSVTSFAYLVQNFQRSPIASALAASIFAIVP